MPRIRPITWLALALLLIRLLLAVGVGDGKRGEVKEDPSLTSLTSPTSLASIPLRLRAGAFDPLAAGAEGKGGEGSSPSSPTSLSLLPPGLYIVQFDHPPTPADRAALQQAGLDLGDYLPDYAYLVRAAAAVGEGKGGEEGEGSSPPPLPGVRWVGPYQPAWRIDPALQTLTPSHSHRERGSDSLSLWETLAPAGSAGGVRVRVPILLETFDGHTVRLTATPAQVQQLATAPDVVWIAPAPAPRRLLNDVARSERIMRVEQAWSRGLFGAGQTVAVADSGLDVGDLSRLNPDFAGRVVATLPLTGTTWSDPVGHGTHVAGSIAGNGAQSGSDPAQHRYTGSQAGMAPAARLVVQSFTVDPSSGEISGLPDDLADLFKPAYAWGARIHSNSWGGPADDEANPYGGYGPEARQTDRFVWQNPDFLPLFAAGNDATDGVFDDDLSNLGDGVVDPDSLSLAATAKNIIAVGATESLRSEGGYAGFPWLFFGLNGLFGQGGIFFSTPIADDDLSNNPEGMAAFSSRGPTDDGRVKPDLVAPGTNILSTRSADPGFDPDMFSWGVYAANDRYVFNGGTSMATPLVAGSAALVRERLQGAGFGQPSAALVKAALVHTARDIAPGQYGEGAHRELQPRPDRSQGWGRVDLGGLFPPAPVSLWFDDASAGLDTGQTATYTHTAARPLTVSDSGHPLRVTLVWTDAPAALAASRQLVNDLDLVLISPSGAVHPSGDPDRLNNVEMVEIAQPERGTWRVEVRAHNVPLGPQRYALAASGAFSNAAPAPTVTPDASRPYQLFMPRVVK